MVLVGLGVLGGQDGGAAGEAVAQGIERGTLLAGFGARAGGVERVGAIGRDAGGGDARVRKSSLHWYGPFESGIACGRSAGARAAMGFVERQRGIAGGRLVTEAGDSGCPAVWWIDL